MTESARATFVLPARDRAVEEDGEERWPIPHAAMFIMVSGAACWAVVLGVIGWLLG